MAASAQQQKTQRPQAGQPQPVVVRHEPEKDLFSWQAPARPFKRRGRDFWVRVIAIAVIGGLILFIAEGAMPVILIISILFLFYILSTVEPEIVEYRITNRGIKMAKRRTDWGALTRYWFSRRFDSQLLIFETLSLPGRLELVINAKDKDSIRKVLSAHLFEEEAPSSNLDRAANWFSKKLPQ